jgi:hypothetical protein
LYELANREKAWAASSDTYVKRALAEVERELSYVERQMKSNVKSPFPSGYRSDLDSTPELDPRRASYYASVMGVLRCCVELGRLDIVIEVQMVFRRALERDIWRRSFMCFVPQEVQSFSPRVRLDCARTRRVFFHGS